MSVRGRAPSQKKDSARVARTPSSSLEDDGGCEAPFRIQLAHGLFDRSKRRLDLEDQGRCRGQVVCEEVDRPSLAVARVGHLRFHFPAVFLEDLTEAAGKERMLLV